MADLAWSVAFLLPNLQIPSSWLRDEANVRALALNLDGIAVVPGDDPRVVALRSRTPALDVLCGAFRGEHGEPHLPSALIIRADVEAAIQRDINALTAFRNALALSFILPARVRLMNDAGWPSISWAEFFEFHPTSIATNGSLYTDTPAFRALFIPLERFQAMPSTAVNVRTDLGTYDPYLAEHLGRLWYERYVDPKQDALLPRLVFRSLEVGFHATSMANKNAGSLGEYGMQVALWVVALEVLARSRRGSSSQHKVLRLLEEYRWDDPRLSHKRYRLRFRQGTAWKVEPGSIIAKLCNGLYRTRHRFVHGDRVGIGTLTPRVGSSRPAMPRVAALVYRAALVARLTQRFERRPWSMEAVDFRENLAGFEYEQALLRVMGVN